ncbi:hypothetical protein B0H14DRAFT_3479839 [Mycena olivaceomarginata]|nr:hypothetical protein B0H14DRAFT_3479839 [Mycena olivaceomarginata]
MVVAGGVRGKDEPGRVKQRCRLSRATSAGDEWALIYPPLANGPANRHRRVSVSGRRASTVEASPSLPTIDGIEDERTQYVLIDNDMCPTSLRSASCTYTLPASLRLSRRLPHTHRDTRPLSSGERVLAECGGTAVGEGEGERRRHVRVERRARSREGGGWGRRAAHGFYRVGEVAGNGGPPILPTLTQRHFIAQLTHILHALGANAECVCAGTTKAAPTLSAPAAAAPALPAASLQVLPVKEKGSRSGSGSETTGRRMKDGARRENVLASSE